MLALHPDWEGAGVIIVRLELDPETARLVQDLDGEGYWRSGEEFDWGTPQARRPDEATDAD